MQYKPDTAYSSIAYSPISTYYAYTVLQFLFYNSVVNCL